MLKGFLLLILRGCCFVGHDSQTGIRSWGLRTSNPVFQGEVCGLVLGRLGVSDNPQGKPATEVFAMVEQNRDMRIEYFIYLN